MLRVGILGCGHIAETMARTLNDIKEAELTAVAARSAERAEAFRKKWGAKRSYGSYLELVEDPDIDLIYVATLMSSHREHITLALEHGKNVLCEKSFCVNAEEAKEVIDLARRKHLYLAEAIWTRYMPSRRRIQEILDSGEIGEIRTITANLSYDIAEKERIARPELGGGAILDIGVYPLNFARMFLMDDPIVRKTGFSMKNAHGADVRDSMIFETESGVQAVLYCDTYGMSDRKGIITGTKGIIEVENINNPEKITVYSLERRGISEKYSFRIDEESTGFEFEVREAARLIREGKTESESMPLDETLFMMETMDDYRRMWDVKLGSEL